MIVVNANLISAISHDRDCSLCVVKIINNNTGSFSKRNYDVELYSRGDKPRLIRKATIENFPSNNLPAWRLISKAFEVLEVA